MLARLRYNSLCMYKDLSAKRAQSTNLVKNSWSTHALPSPPLFQCWDMILKLRG